MGSHPIAGLEQMVAFKSQSSHQSLDRAVPDQQVVLNRLDLKSLIAGRVSVGNTDWWLAPTLIGFD